MQAWRQQLSAGLYILRVQGGAVSQKRSPEQVSLHGQVRGALAVCPYSSQCLGSSSGDGVSMLCLLAG